MHGKETWEIKLQKYAGRKNERWWKIWVPNQRISCTNMLKCTRKDIRYKRMEV